MVRFQYIISFIQFKRIGMSSLYENIVESVKYGRLKEFDETMNQKKSEFIKAGTFLVIEKVLVCFSFLYFNE